MIIKKVNLTNFRNFEKLDIAFSDGINIFYGNNGSGKTNLLESVFVLCLGRSHRAATETVMVNSNSDYYRIEAEVKIEEKQIELAVAYQRGVKKKITIDKVAVRLSELYENFTAVAVGPEDSEIIAGAPSFRRNFVDIYLSQYSSKYLNNLTNYHKILSQKNAALKQKIDPGPYNELLVRSGAEIISQRIDFIKIIRKEAVECYENISGGSRFECSYKPSVIVNVENPDINIIISAFTQQLYNYIQKEQIMEQSLIGPHRDDIYFEINGLPARTHGSQGEWRTAAVALKMAVYNLLKNKKETPPILLLDEIFAELDNSRSQSLVELFDDFGQLFLTTAIQPPDFLEKDSRKFEINNGKVVKII